MSWASLRRGGTDLVTGAALPAQPAEIPFYQKMFSLLPPLGGSPVPIIGCPLGANGDGCASQSQASLNNNDGENLIVVKLDHTINAENSIWYRFQQDTGLQAAYTDPDQLRFSIPTRRSHSELSSSDTPMSSVPLWSISSTPVQAGIRASSSRTTTVRFSGPSQLCSLRAATLFRLRRSVAMTTPIRRAAKSHNGKSMTT